MSVSAFRLKGLRFERFDRRFLTTLIPNCWLKTVIAPTNGKSGGVEIFQHEHEPFLVQ